jgi:hypothetical protein
MRIKSDVPIPPTVVQHEVIRPLVRPGDQHAIVGLAKSKQWVKSIEGLRGVISLTPTALPTGEGRVREARRTFPIFGFVPPVAV